DGSIALDGEDGEAVVVAAAFDGIAQAGGGAGDLHPGHVDPGGEIDHGLVDIDVEVDRQLVRGVFLAGGLGHRDAGPIILIEYGGIVEALAGATGAALADDYWAERPGLSRRRDWGLSS